MEIGQQLHTAALIAEAPDAQRLVAQLEEGKSVIVGAGKSCGLFLNDPALATMHCSFRLCEGKLWVQDWCSDSGTFVNGQRIADETVVPAGASVAVGRYTITAVTSGTAKQVETASPRQELPVAPPSVAENRTASVGPPDWEVSPPLRDDGDGDDLIHREPETTDSSDLWPTWNEVDDSQSLLQDGDCFANDTIELLRAEVEHLQGELAERDARINELESSAAGDCELSLVPSSDEIATLSDRLEQLLDELTQSDQRIEQLEEMLRLSEEASRAEQEERSQLEAWVNDIERRIGQREEEWQAENEGLTQRTKQLRAERDQLEKRLKRAAAGGATNTGADYEGVLDGLRKQNDELHHQLDEANKERASLQKRFEDLQLSQSEEAQKAQVNEALRLERAGVAKERAELARMRAELTGKLSDVERQLKPAESTEVDNRLHALREHLKEIHAEEKTERVDRSLSNRIAQIWKRLER